MLALQGDWAIHRQALEKRGCESFPVRTAAELQQCDALVLPGGESTAMLRLMEREHLGEHIRQLVTGGMPVLATCAGVILLARRVEPAQPSLDLLDVDVVRNAYGRQVASSVTVIDLDPVLGPPPQMEGVFIRAPRIVRVGDGVEVLAWRGTDAVLLRQGRILAATFHPELCGDDSRIYELFLPRRSR